MKSITKKLIFLLTLLVVASIFPTVANASDFDLPPVVLPTATPGPDPEVITELPEHPVFVDDCGIDNDSYAIPEDTDKYTYVVVTVADPPSQPLNDISVWVEPREGFVFPPYGNNWYGTVYWDHSYNREPCEAEPVVVVPGPPLEEVSVPIPVAEPAEELAETNVDYGLWAIPASVLVAGGIVLLVYRRRKHARNL